MEHQGTYLHTPKSSSSSAIDLAHTPAGFPTSAPPSPSLDASDSGGGSFARRRTSRGQRLVDEGQDSLQLDDLPLSSGLNTSGSAPVRSGVDILFPTPDNRNFPFSARYEIPDGNYLTSHAGPSTASLISPREFEAGFEYREDDEAHLTANMSRNGTEENWEAYRSEDPERSAVTTPRSRRRTARYSLSPSPLKKTGTAIKSMKQNLRRASVRVVNLGSAGLESQIRLEDVNEDARSKGKLDEGEEEPLHLNKSLPIRGRTLGCFGIESKVRLALFNLLVYPWTEPAILMLIIVNAVILTLQSSPRLTLPTSDGRSFPPMVKGYFHTWEDYALFVLFIIFTLEAFARICVFGFLFDPEVSLTSMFQSPFRPHSERYPTTPLGPPHSAAIGRFGSLSHGSLERGNTITKRLSKFSRSLLRPFALAPTATSPYPHAPPSSEISLTNDVPPINPVADKAMQKDVQGALRVASKSTYFSNALRSDTSDVISLPFQLSINNIRDKARRNVPYLRQSWTRIDFIAIVSFWIMFSLATAGVERGTYHIGLFRAMSVIRTARLLSITSGTTTIMHSLKTARPLLTRVAYFVLFAMVLFSIIGIQSFKGSLRRTCSLVAILGENNTQIATQFCGGHIDPVTLSPTGYIALDGSTTTSSKGYICPLGQLCLEQENPFNNVESFDTIHYAALQVIITASANGWSPLMYSMIDAEFFVSCIFFIVCIIVLNFWLINLFVAVITNTFSAIRSQTHKSAFGAAPLVGIDERDEDWATISGRKASRVNLIKIFYEHTRWCWVLLALASLVLQATRTDDSDDIHQQLMSFGELGITIAFDFEIILRVIATLPDWRNFLNHGNNWLDTTLAIGSSIIQIPMIHNSGVYPWFTIFQLARFYRVILEVPRMRPLLLAVFGNMYGLANMTLFLLLVNYISALAVVQLLRGDVGQDVPTNFGELFNAFLSIYQIFSSENWPTVLYAAIKAESSLGQTVVVTIFIAGWLLFANFIVLQMFIAVINENFEVSEESKRTKQASTYWASHRPQTATAPWLRRFNPYRWLKAKPVTVKVENLPSNLVLPMQKSLVQNYTAPRYDNRPGNNQQPITSTSKPRHYSARSLNVLERLFAGKTRSNDVPLAKLRHVRSESIAKMVPHDEEMERHLELLAAVNPEMTSEDANDALQEQRAQKADFIRDHPSYDKTFWIFSQKNWLRKLCQNVVRPANGERIFGTPHSHIAHPIFQLILLLSVIGGIVVEGVASPIYRRNYFITYGFHFGAWFEIAEAVFGFTLVLEFLIKTIADGFLFTPNAYILSIWNVLDFIIMVGILVNVSTSLVIVGGISRFTRSLKALRALRLITLVDKMRNTFQSLIISGAVRILDAAVLAILYMIPYAVWGLNIFAGRMNTCNDTSVSGISSCIGEYSNTIYGTSFGFLTPRVWDKPSPSTTFSFDNFRSSLLILFEIVSLEGWIDVMWFSASITGKGQQPSNDVSQVNALFFMVYNLLGGVVIMTLFVSIIIGNFKAKTGSAFLTTPQREWIDLQKLFRRQRPSKRPQFRPRNYIRAWCFDRAVHKHGWWTRGMTFLFILHIFALMTQTFTVHSLGDKFRNDFFLGLMFVYVIDVAVRWFGLGWTSFRANGWNLFDIVVAGGSFVTTLILRFGTNSFALDQLQKLFLVSIAFKLVQKNNSLNMLFKTSVASLPVILNLLGLWLVLFIFFAILKVEVFSMTKWGSGENRNQNYSSIGTALVMLSFMSVGEGWNQYMHNYAISYPRCTNPSSQMDSDCGSEGWALALFIAWNLLSMYIFVNMFTGVVVENFSYVFQTSAGGAKSITREQMRAFKKVWAEFANTRTGYLERHRFVPFFARLSGAFEVKIYPTEYSIPNIMRACKQSPHPNTAWVEGGLDLGKLESLLNGIDYSMIRKRRAIYSRLYHEAIISHQPGRGISFNDMLLLLAHHKLIIDGEALILKDLVVRTETNKLVTDLVNLDRVRSLLKTISCRKQFLAYKERLHQKEIPSIVVDSLSDRSPSISVNDGYDASVYGPRPSPTPDRRFSSTPDVSLALDNTPKLQRSSRRTSDISRLSTDLGYSSQRSSMVETDLQNVLSSMQNSMWGDLMLEAAAEEEERM